MDPPVVYNIRTHNIDGALRHHSVIRLLAEEYRPELRILEVGSGSGGITEFLQHPVTGVDPAFERTADRATPWLTPVQGSAEALPFADASFDAVLSMEMLEHLPAEIRATAISEMWRVLAPSGRMILTFPADAVAERLDRRLNDSYRKHHGSDHPWLAEHIANGLPRTAQVAEHMRRAVGEEGSVAIHKHAWAPAWMLHQTLFSAQRGFPLTGALLIHTRWFARGLFYLLRDLHFGENCYRTMIVADRSASAADPVGVGDSLADASAADPLGAATR